MSKELKLTSQEKAFYLTKVLETLSKLTPDNKGKRYGFVCNYLQQELYKGTGIQYPFKIMLASFEAFANTRPKEKHATDDAWWPVDEAGWRKRVDAVQGAINYYLSEE